jgi:hypothetical protein
MASVLHARVSFPDGTTLEDTASVGFTFMATTPAPIVPTDLITWLTAFFNEAAAGPTPMTHPLAFYMSPDITDAAGGCPVNIYDVTADLSGAPVGSPVLVSSITLETSAATASLPAQIAAVLAYRSAYGTDIEKGIAEIVPSTESAQDQGAPATHSAISKPRARDRGRIHLGPLNSGVLESTAVLGAGHAGQMTSVFATDLLNAGLSYMIPTTGTGGANFTNAVWSRVGAFVKPIAMIAVDAGLAVIRKRADTVINRVLSWIPVDVT